MEEDEGFGMSEFVPSIGRFLILFFSANVTFNFTNVCIRRNGAIEHDSLNDGMPPAYRNADVLIGIFGESG